MRTNSDPSTQDYFPWRSTRRIMIGIVYAACVVSAFRFDGIGRIVSVSTALLVPWLIGFLWRAYIARLRRMPIPKLDGGKFTVKANLPHFLQHQPDW